MRPDELEIPIIVEMQLRTPVPDVENAFFEKSMDNLTASQSILIRRPAQVYTDGMTLHLIRNHMRNVLPTAITRKTFKEVMSCPVKK